MPGHSSIAAVSVASRLIEPSERLDPTQRSPIPEILQRRKSCRRLRTRQQAYQRKMRFSIDPVRTHAWRELRLGARRESGRPTKWRGPMQDRLELKDHSVADVTLVPGIFLLPLLVHSRCNFWPCLSRVQQADPEKRCFCVPD